jgi:integrase
LNIVEPGAAPVIESPLPALRARALGPLTPCQPRRIDQVRHGIRACHDSRHTGAAYIRWLGGYAPMRTTQEVRRGRNVSAVMIYTHALSRRLGSLGSLVDRRLEPTHTP